MATAELETTIDDFDIRTHNGCVTMTNPETGQHRTVKIRTQKDDAKFAPGERIISILSGPCNETDFRGFGFVKKDGRVAVWSRHRGTALEKIARMIEDPSRFHARGIEFQVEGRCIKCNRKLTDPESIRLGIGPVCRGE